MKLFRLIREYFLPVFPMASAGLALIVVALYMPSQNDGFWLIIFLFSGLFFFSAFALALSLIDLRRYSRDREETTLFLDNFQNVLSSRMSINLRNEDLVHIGRYFASILGDVPEWRLWLKLPPDLMRDTRAGMTFFTIGDPDDPPLWAVEAEASAQAWWKNEIAEKRDFDIRLPGHRIQLAGYKLTKGAIVAAFYCPRWPSAIRLQNLKIALVLFGHFLVGLRATVIEARRLVDSETYGHVVSTAVHEISRELGFMLSRLIMVNRENVMGILPPVFQSLQRASNCLEWVRQWKQVDQDWFHVAPRPMPIRPFLDDLEDYMERAWPNLMYSSHGALDQEIIGDNQLTAVFQNLLTNAAEASPEHGSLDVEVSREGKFVVIYISDLGPGIPAGNEDRIFQALVTDSNGKQNGRRGTGIGLFLCRRITQALGGSVDYCGPSKIPNRDAKTGSCFAVRLLAAEVTQ